MKYSCVIIEDEPLAQKVLQKYISDTPTLELVSTCADAFQAQEAISLHQPQLIFLDVNMPKLSGVNFLKALCNPPKVIFTTAYAEYAVEGFNLDAVDYLLKPFSFERFYKAINKAINSISQQQQQAPVTSFITLKADKKIYKVDFEDISYLEAYGDYVKVHLADKMLLIYDKFKNITAQLPDNQFVRIHKSYCIALGKIEYIDGNQVRVMNKLLPVSLTYKEKLMIALNRN